MENNFIFFRKTIKRKQLHKPKNLYNTIRGLHVLYIPLREKPATRRQSHDYTIQSINRFENIAIIQKNAD
jgi:hypothetical protein